MSPETICDKMGVEYQTIKNSTDRNRNLYSLFSQQLITDGTIQWHKHSNHKDTVIMSDYNPSTGYLSPLSYCYVMQAVLSFSCLGDKCLSHAKLMSTALTQLLIFRFPCLLTNKGIAQCIDNSN